MYEDTDGSMVARKMVYAHLLESGRQDGTLQEQADIRKSYSRILGIDSSASGSDPPITSRNSSLAMVLSNPSCTLWD